MAQAKFISISKTIEKLSNSWIPEIVFLIIIYGTFFLQLDLIDL